MTKRSKQKSITKSSSNIKIAATQSPLKTMLLTNGWIIAILSFAIYANTITHEYTQDDAIVIYDNMYTKDGVSGIPGLLKYDTFRGFFKTEGKANLVSGGRYRPLTPIMFAVEYQLAPNSPWLSHFLNILLYCFLGVLIFWTLRQLLAGHLHEKTAFWVSLSAALLYIAHPLHTEAVANIKGRDEIVAMLASIGAVYLGLKYMIKPNIKSLGLIALVFFLGLMSKENTITFLAVWPLAALLFKKDNWKSSIAPWLAMMAATVIFLIIRTTVLGFDLGGAPMELMNNPFLKLEGNRYVTMDLGEKMATIIYTLGKYIQLLVFPHPLTHDYYPRHIAMMTFSDPKVLLSLLGYLILAVIALFQWKKNPIITFGILYFIITLSIVSNIVFPIGTNMSERFMFMPSLGFALLLSWLIMHRLVNKTSLKTGLAFLSVITLLYSVKTISRNKVWVNDYTLFTTDVKTSKNSAKVLNAAGGALTTEAFKLADSNKKTQMLNEAVGYLNQSLRIHPGYKNPALILGNAQFYLGKYEEAIKAYETALSISPSYNEAEKNLAITLREVGKIAGEQERNITKSLKYLKRSITLRPGDIETIRLLGVASGVAGDHDSAVKYFEQVVAQEPNKVAYQNLGRAYGNQGRVDKANEMFQKASEMK